MAVSWSRSHFLSAIATILLIGLTLTFVFLVNNNSDNIEPVHPVTVPNDPNEVISSANYDLIRNVFGINGADHKMYKSYYNKTVPPPGVIIHLKGGIGNQLFQYACSYALARDRKWPLYMFYKLPPSDAKEREYKPFQREFVLDQFNIPLDNLMDDTTVVSNVRYLSDQELLEKPFVQWENVNTRFLVQGGGSYCQSIEYWLHYQKEIKTFFRPRVELLNMPKLQHHIDKLRSTESVIVHVRRGDFTRVRGFDVPISFQRQAIRKMIDILNSRGTKPTFFVFSDEIDYVMEKFKDFAQKFEFIYVSKELKDAKSIEEFFLMTLGKHIILPNSTFSWWAAYLMANKNKVVIASAFNPTFYEMFDGHEKEGWFNRQLFGKLYHPKGWIVIHPFTGGLEL